MKCEGGSFDKQRNSKETVYSSINQQLQEHVIEVCFYCHITVGFHKDCDTGITHFHSAR